MDSLSQFFHTKASRLLALGEIAGRLKDAASAVAPLVPAATSLFDDGARLAAEAGPALAGKRSELDAFDRARAGLKREAGVIAGLDGGGAKGGGTGPRAALSRFVSSCGDCASALASAPASAAGGAGPCADASAGADHLAEELSRVRNLVDTTVKLVEAVRRSAQDLEEAGGALVKIAPAAGSGARGLLERCADDVNRAADAVNAALAILEPGVVPPVIQLGADFPQQLSDSTQKLLVCRGKLLDLVALAKPDSARGAAHPRRPPDLRADERPLAVLRSAPARAVPKVEAALTAFRGGTIRTGATREAGRGVSEHSARLRRARACGAGRPVR